MSDESMNGLSRDGLRRLMKARRAALTAEERLEKSLRIRDAVLTLSEVQKAKRILCYMALPTEVQTRPLIEALWEDGREVCLPVTRPDGTMDAVRVTPETAFRKSALGVMEPASGEIIPPNALDLVLTPGVAFDRKGNRLGFGKGCYDRYLENCLCPAVGLAFDVQIAGRIEALPHDRRVTHVVTETGIIR